MRTNGILPSLIWSVGRESMVRLCRYLSWDDYFMALAFLSAQRSKDPNKQVHSALRALMNILISIISLNHISWAVYFMYLSVDFYLKDPPFVSLQ